MLGDGRRELRAVIDGECQRGLQQLKELLFAARIYLSRNDLASFRKAVTTTGTAIVPQPAGRNPANPEGLVLSCKSRYL